MRRRHPAEYIRRRLLSRAVRNVETGCLEWIKPTNNGYGRMWDGERPQYVHRLSFEVFVGPIPEGLDVLHQCDNTKCIEPTHLEPGTHQKNMTDKALRGNSRSAKVRASWERRRGQPSKSRGSAHRRAKLLEWQAADVKRRVLFPLNNRDGPSALAREYGVSESLVRRIRDGQGWGWLQVEAPPWAPGATL